MEAKKVSIIIPCHNRKDLTLQCFRSVRNSAGSFALEIIIVDNASTDGTAEAIMNEGGAFCLRLPENRGFAGAANYGLHACGGVYAVVMHNDVVVPGRWLAPLISALEENRKTAIAGPMTNWTTGPQWEQRAHYENVGDLEEYVSKRVAGSGATETEFLKSFCMAFPLDLVYAIGGFDERFFPARIEDEDYCFRAQAEGLKTVIAPASFVHHHGSATLGRNEEPVSGILERNKKRFFEKHKVPAKTGSESIILMSGERKEDGASAGAINELLSEANRIFADGNLEDAESLYLRLREQSPDSLEILFDLVILYLQRGFLEKAQELVADMQRINAGFAPAYYAEGLLRIRQNRHAEALERFKTSVNYDVNYQLAYNGYRETAELLGKQVSGIEADVVFYTAGMSFDGGTINERGLGGSESAMYHMAKELAALGLKVRVYNKCARPGIYEDVEYGDLADFYIFNHHNRARVFISSRSFRPFIHRINADKYAVWLHDTVDSAYFQNIETAEFDWDKLEPFVLSNWQARTWAGYLGLPVEKFYITRNGIDPERFSVSPPVRKRNKLIYSSRPVRGLEILLDMFPRIRLAIPDAELHVFTYELIAGDAETHPFEAKLRQPGVIVRGSVSQRQLALEMMEARLLLYPSIFEETSCITAIEAQAAGLPIITSAIAAMPETVADGVSGIIVPGDPRSPEFQERFIRAAVDLMRDDARWTALGENGRSRVRGHYHWKEIAREWVEHIFPGEELQSGPKLSLCMIVKNEAELLPGFFESIKDLVHEIIVVDTGSSDETVSIALSIGARVFNIPWVDDFAHARNESLKHASGDWILYLDPDERINSENRAKIRQLIADPGIDALNLVEHIPQSEGNLMRSIAESYCRLFRNRRQYLFEGRIHEQILPSILRAGGRIRRTDIVIEHTYYGKSQEKKKERIDRNRRILLRELAERPDDSFILFNLGCTEREAGNKEEAKKCFSRLLALDAPDLKPELLSTSAVFLGQFALAEGAVDEVYRMALLAKNCNENNVLGWYLEAAAAFEEENFRRAKAALERVESMALDPAHENLHGAIDRFQVYMDLGNCHYKLENFTDAHEFYARAKRLKPESVEAMFNDGNALLRLGEKEKAGILFRELIGRYPDFEPARRNLKLCGME